MSAQADSTQGIAAAAAILDRKLEIEALSNGGHRRAALVMAWSLLEAALRSVGSADDRARSTAAVLDILAMDGLVEPDMERRLRPLVTLRNRIVHGDLQVEPARDEVSALLAAVDQVLLAEAT